MKLHDYNDALLALRVIAIDSSESIFLKIEDTIASRRIQLRSEPQATKVQDASLKVSGAIAEAYSTLIDSIDGLVFSPNPETSQLKLRIALALNTLEPEKLPPIQQWVKQHPDVVSDLKAALPKEEPTPLTSAAETMKKGGIFTQILNVLGLEWKR